MTIEEQHQGRWPCSISWQKEYARAKRQAASTPGYEDNQAVLSVWVIWLEQTRDYILKLEKERDEWKQEALQARATNTALHKIIGESYAQRDDCKTELEEKAGKFTKEEMEECFFAGMEHQRGYEDVLNYSPPSFDEWFRDRFAESSPEDLVEPLKDLK